MTNTLAYYGIELIAAVRSFVKLFWSCIHNTLFSSKLTSGPNKPDCSITIGLTGFPGTNTVAY
jgi:hypothetical protein